MAEDYYGTFERLASETDDLGSETALAMAKREARSELRRIFEDEAKQGESQGQHSLSRQATASSHS